MANLKQLILLHSNDMHGDFLAESCDENLIGGVGLLSGYVTEAREKERNVLYCIAGDMFQGSIIDAEYKGISTIEIMNRLAPDVVTLGNHEFDYGVSHLLFIEKCAKFPIINANVFIKNNRTRMFSPCLVKEIGGMKILFIGIITEMVMAHAKKDPLVGTFIDTEDAAKAVDQICNSYKGVDIDFTVLLTHIGFEEDIQLAKLLSKHSGVDVIIGGHSHTILEKPYEENGILIVQAGVGTNQIGRFDITIDTDSNSIHDYAWQLLPINDQTCPRDEGLEKLIRDYKDITDLKYSRLVTKFKRKLTHPKRTEETALGNLFSDILMESLAVDIMLLGSGSIRSLSLGPIVEYGNLVEAFPYAAGIHLLKLDGALLKKILHYILRKEMMEGHTECFQYSKGVKIIYDQKAEEFEEFSLNGLPVEDGRLYTIGLQEFHLKNSETSLGFSIDELSVHQKPRLIAVSDQSLLEEYLQSHNLLSRKVEGRLTLKP